MAIQGPYSDGGYTIFCNECGARITCFHITEIFGDKSDLKNFDYKKAEEKFKEYDCFYCSDCLPIMKNKKRKLDEREFTKYLYQWLIMVVGEDEIENILDDIANESKSKENNSKS